MSLFVAGTGMLELEFAGASLIRSEIASRPLTDRYYRS